jgi:3-oxoacyl-[acyl-carrier protein] reductase
MKCLILGGTGYVGREVCKRLHNDGHHIYFTWHENQCTATELIAELKGSQGFQLDFRNDCKSEFQNIIQQMDGIDILIQCAGTAGKEGIYKKGADKFQQISTNDFNEMMKITVGSTFTAAQEAAQNMHENGGQIIIVGSMDGVKPVPAPIHYAAAKGALTSMTSALAKELGKNNIRVNLIAPGMLEGGLARFLSDDLKNEYLHHCSMNRLGNATEITDLIQWMVNKNTYLTGQTLLLDGAL